MGRTTKKRKQNSVNLIFVHNVNFKVLTRSQHNTYYNIIIFNVILNNNPLSV